VGRLTKCLRLMGYDALFFNGEDDAEMVRKSLREDRVLLTRDTRIMKRGVVTSGRLKAILIESEDPEEQLKQVMDTLHLDSRFQPFSICLECNQPLVARSRDEVKGRVPPYVFKTQRQYMECPECHRVYWRGTHWKAMMKKLERLADY